MLSRVSEPWYMAEVDCQNSRCKGGVDMTLNRFLHQVHRFISWILVPFMAVFIVSGYSYTRKIRVINRGLAFDLHNTLDLPFLLLIMAHVTLAARFELMRFKIKGKIVDVFLLVLAVAAGLAIIWVDQRILR